MFKIRYINRERFSSAKNVSGVVGNAFHTAMEVLYTKGNLEEALEAGMNFLEEYPEGFIQYSTTVANKQAAQDKYAFAFSSYAEHFKLEEVEVLSCEEMIEENVDVEWNGSRVTLPIKLKGYVDKILRSKQDGRIKIVDYKTCASFSDEEKIDGAKILQAIQSYFLVYAKYGEEPYSFTYEEVKLTKNRDGGPQVREYEIVYAENEIYFQFFLRFYEDIVRAMNGEQVYVPNVHAFFDNEVAIVAYVQRLDMADEVAERMKVAQVTTISDLLKTEMQSVKNMNALMKAAETAFVAANSIDYENMEIQDRIKTKLMEHGMLCQYDSKIDGASVDLYRYNPSIGLKMSRLRNYTDDMEQVLGVSGVRVLAPIPNSTMVGIEVPKTDRRFPAPPEGQGWELAIGETVDGKVRRFDIRQAPHMLVAGSTGSGKSVFLGQMIEQLHQLDNVELHLFDPKRVELAQYKDMAKEYLHDASDITLALAYLVDTMDQRYAQLALLGVRDVSQTDIPYKVVVIDEYADIVARQIDNKDKATAMHYIQILAQKGRAAGIHIILATQRASTKVITGDIKVNFPVKVVFRMAKGVDSRVMIDEDGAEKLLGKGDMLFQSENGIERLQGYFA